MVWLIEMIKQLTVADWLNVLLTHAWFLHWIGLTLNWPYTELALQLNWPYTELALHWTGLTLNWPFTELAFHWTGLTLNWPYNWTGLTLNWPYKGLQHARILSESFLCSRMACLIEMVEQLVVIDRLMRLADWMAGGLAGQLASLDILTDWTDYDWLNEWMKMCMWPVKTSTQNLACSQHHTNTCIRCIHAGSHKLKLPDIHANKVQTAPTPAPPPPHPSPCPNPPEKCILEVKIYTWLTGLLAYWLTQSRGKNIYLVDCFIGLLAYTFRGENIYIFDRLVYCRIGSLIYW